MCTHIYTWGVGVFGKALGCNIPVYIDIKWVSIHKRCGTAAAAAQYTYMYVAHFGSSARAGLRVAPSILLFPAHPLLLAHATALVAGKRVQWGGVGAFLSACAAVRTSQSISAKRGVRGSFPLPSPSGNPFVG